MSDKTARQLKMIEEFQCPGCMHGSDTECGSFKLHEETIGYNNSQMFRCAGHVPGTSILGAGKFCLGFPKGFDKVGEIGKPNIELYLKDEKPHWNHLNVPVWAIDKGGFVFVRTFMPRINKTSVLVWEEGKLPEQAIDVSKFYDDID